MGRLYRKSSPQDAVSAFNEEEEEEGTERRGRRNRKNGGSSPFGRWETWMEPPFPCFSLLMQRRFIGRRQKAASCWLLILKSCPARVYVIHVLRLCGSSLESTGQGREWPYPSPETHSSSSSEMQLTLAFVVDIQRHTCPCKAVVNTYE